MHLDVLSLQEEDSTLSAMYNIGKLCMYKYVGFYTISNVQYR